MNAAIDSSVLSIPNTQSHLDLPGIQQVFHHPTFIKVINELKAPKVHTNEFGGGYKYRSAEDIQEALKPVLLKHKCSVIMRKFDVESGFEIYAYIVFKDQTYMRCELPGVASYDFDRDLSNNKKITRTQQYAVYQSYAKKYALCNLLMIDDSQNDLDAITNENIQKEQQKANRQQYRNPQNNRVVIQADCDRAIKQIEDLPISTSLPEAIQFFDNVIGQFPEFYNALNSACQKKHAEIEQYLNSANGHHTGAVSPQNNSATSNQPTGANTAQRSSSNEQMNKNLYITAQQRDELQAFIAERGLDVKGVCDHLGINALTKIPVANLEEFKGYIDDLARQELQP